VRSPVPLPKRRGFLTAVGTTPKVFSRISRFLDVCHYLKDYQHRTLTKLCQECGYYDQSHFIREFRVFSGFTPTEFFAGENVVFADM